MEHIESMNGTYPATEGLLLYLCVLFSTAGREPNLGVKHRRPGTTPYIEYVVSFVLPRIISLTGTDSKVSSQKRSIPLPFSSPADKHRLLSRALEVISVVISGYIVPPPAPSTNPSSTPTLEAVQQHHNNMMEVAERLGLTYSEDIINLSDEKSYNLYNMEACIRDFRDERISIPLSSSSYIGDQQTENIKTALVPRAKSPGFTLLAQILGGGNILKYLLLAITEHSGSFGINGLENEARAKIKALALFQDTKPNFSEYRRYAEIMMDFEHSRSYGEAPPQVSPTLSLLKPPVLHMFSPRISSSDANFCLPNDAKLWRERSITLSLQILCSVAAREDAFSKSLNASPVPLTIVPVLRFVPARRSPAQHTGLEVYNISVSRLSSSLIEAAGSTPFNSSYLSEPLPAIAQFVGCKLNEEELAKRAVGILSYVAISAPPRVGVPALCGRAADGAERLAEAFSKRLFLTYDYTSAYIQVDDDDDEAMDIKQIITNEKNHSTQNSSVCSIILDLLLSTLSSQSPNLSHVLLGFDTKNGLPYGTRDSQAFESSNCLDAVLELVSDENFLLNPFSAHLAAKSYELIFRLCSGKAGAKNQAITMSKLRKENFWFEQAEKYFTNTSMIEVIRDQSPVDLSSRFQFRNSQIMHALAWLLKGMSLELHSLMGLDSSGSMEDNDLCPQPTQCRKLLDVVISSNDTNSIVYQILFSIPLGDFEGSAQAFLCATGTPPPREVVMASKRRLSGSIELTDRYQSVDLNTMLNLMQESNNDAKCNALRWAKRWNSYVSWTCASCHLSLAWGSVIDTVLSSCGSLVLGYSNNIELETKEGHLLDCNDVINLMQSILVRLGGGSNVKDATAHESNEMEAGCALPLAVAVLRLTEALVNMELTDSYSEEFLQNVGNVCLFIANSISVCGECGDEHDERAVILSSALVALFDWIQLNELKDSSYFCNEKGQREAYLAAGVHLSKLSGRNLHNNMSTDVNFGKATAIVLAAREGLSSTICFFEGKDDHHLPNHPNNFLLYVFEGSDGEARLSRLIKLLNFTDSEIAWTLLSIAQCRYGSEILFQAGVPAALLAVVHNQSSNLDYLNGHNSIQSDRELYGSVEISPPSYLLGHLVLLSAMLSTLSDNRMLALEAAKYIQSHAKTMEHLLRMYPRSGDLTEKFLLVLSLVVSALSENSFQFTHGDQSQGIQKNQIERALGNSLPLIERRVIDFGLHIASFPFPSSFLPPLPKALIDLERLILSRQRQVTVNVEKSWWDRLPQDEQKSVRLPNPPGRNNSYSDTSLFSQNGNNIDHSWSEEKYSFSISAASSLELALIFLKRRLKSSGLLAIDGIALAKGICRCTDIANAIGNHLASSGSSSSLTKKSRLEEYYDESLALHAKQVEEDALSTLGPILGRCSESLLTIASLYLRSLNDDQQNSPHASHRALVDFGSAIKMALDHTQIERVVSIM